MIGTHLTTSWKQQNILPATEAFFIEVLLIHRYFLFLIYETQYYSENNIYGIYFKNNIPCWPLKARHPASQMLCCLCEFQYNLKGRSRLTLNVDNFATGLLQLGCSSNLSWLLNPSLRRFHSVCKWKGRKGASAVLWGKYKAEYGNRVCIAFTPVNFTSVLNVIKEAQL